MSVDVDDIQERCMMCGRRLGGEYEEWTLDWHTQHGGTYVPRDCAGFVFCHRCAGSADLELDYLHNELAKAMGLPDAEEWEELVEERKEEEK